VKSSPGNNQKRKRFGKQGDEHRAYVPDVVWHPLPLQFPWINGKMPTGSSEPEHSPTGINLGIGQIISIRIISERA